MGQFATKQFHQDDSPGKVRISGRNDRRCETSECHKQRCEVDQLSVTPEENNNDTQVTQISALVASIIV